MNYYFDLSIKYIKIMFSLIFEIFSIKIIVIGISNGYSISNYGSIFVSFILLIFALLLLAANEAFQVAAMRIKEMDIKTIEKKGYFRAAMIHKLLFENDNKLNKLFIGQSFIVVLCSFIIASITTFPNYTADKAGTSNPFYLYIYYSSGLPGVFFTVTIAQLLPSIFAKKNPLITLNIPGLSINPNHIIISY